MNVTKKSNINSHKKKAIPIDLPVGGISKNIFVHDAYNIKSKLLSGSKFILKESSWMLRPHKEFLKVIKIVFENWRFLSLILNSKAKFTVVYAYWDIAMLKPLTGSKMLQFLRLRSMILIVQPCRFTYKNQKKIGL